MEQANALINVLFVDEFTINVAGIEGRIFRTMPNQDRWSLQVGGFYNWHQPLDIVIRKSEEQLLRIAK